MAAEADPEKAPQAAQPPAASHKQTIIATLVVTVIAAAMGALFAVPAPPVESAAKAAPADKPHATGATGVFDLPPVVTNIGSPHDTWVRVESSIVYDAKALPHPEALAGEIAGDELAYLRTIALTQIEGPIGLQNVRQDLSERAAIRSGGKVAELIIRTLVVQ